MRSELATRRVVVAVRFKVTDRVVAEIGSRANIRIFPAGHSCATGMGVDGWCVGRVSMGMKEAFEANDEILDGGEAKKKNLG